MVKTKSNIASQDNRDDTMKIYQNNKYVEKDMSHSLASKWQKIKFLIGFLCFEV